MIVVLPGVAWAGLVPGSPGGPVLLTPGSASWNWMTTPSGTRTEYTLTSDTVLDWGRFQLPAGDELVFSGGAGVVNLLGGTREHRIEGSVVADGVIGFFANGAGLRVDGSVTGKAVTVATLGTTDAAAFLTGSGYTMNATAPGLRVMTVDGALTATGGDVVVAGEFVNVRGGALIEAAGAVRMGGARTVTVAADGQWRTGTAGVTGVVQHLGASRGTSVEIEARQEIANAGRIEGARVFLEVGRDGKILNEGSGVIIGNLQVVGDFDNDGTVLLGDEGDALVAANSSLLRLPELKRPDGSSVSRARELRRDVAMTASSDSQRDRSASGQIAGKQAGSVLRRLSFFGMRGAAGQAAAEKKPER
jgi:hypothetical protein